MRKKLHPYGPSLKPAVWAAVNRHKLKRRPAMRSASALAPGEARTGIKRAALSTNLATSLKGRKFYRVVNRAVFARIRAKLSYR